MSTLEKAAAEFLSSDGIAVVGVSRDARSAANAIYRKLRSGGKRVIPVNRRAGEAEGDACYPDLRSIPGGVRAVCIVAPPEASLDIVNQCRELGISHVWIHGSFGFGSVSAEAVAFCRNNGIRVIAGACPMMFLRPVDFGHRCMRTVLGWLGRLPGGA
jgi:predicted CoA-binding protein